MCVCVCVCVCVLVCVWREREREREIGLQGVRGVDSSYLLELFLSLFLQLTSLF